MSTGQSLSSSSVDQYLRSPARAGDVFPRTYFFPRRYFARGTGSSNPAPSSRQSVSLPHPLSSVENPGFPRGVGGRLAAEDASRGSARRQVRHKARVNRCRRAPQTAAAMDAEPEVRTSSLQR